MTAARFGPLLALALLAPAGAVAAAQLGGTVFEDANGNGRRDAGEPGIAGVALSNGRDIVRSATDGSYAIAARADDVVFAIKPADRRFGMRADGLPAFWRVGTQAAHGAGSGAGNAAGPPFDVALSRRRNVRGPMQVLLFSDPQVASLVDVDYYYTDIVAPLAGTSAALGMTLGDLVDDAPDLYPALNAVTASLGVPWLHVAGNHDIDAGAASDADNLRTFHARYGPDTVAWEEAQATFIGLDDVIAMPGQRPAYVGGLREDQFAFLEAYLPTVRKDRLLVVAAHIPFFDTAPAGVPPTFRAADRERLFALLRDFPHVLLLSGHTHNQMHVFHQAANGWHGATPLHQYNVGAACGAYWSGVEDAQGVPDSTMGDGTPNGYAVLAVAGHGDYRLAWHNARDAADSQIGLHAPKVLRRGAYPAFGVYANVYMGFDGGRVEYRIDEGDWKPMAKVLAPDPRLLAENARDDEADALRGYDRSPEATPSTHLWRGVLATDLAAGSHRVEVRYFDPWRGEQRAATDYRLDEPAP
ncbi:calcineurin-like phosphoesterase C-terminal domain-containing protein [Luteimonas sp. 50]|uniref:Calcineurin-like phosphoesterase C-terminal domain-containing protein n=1 Tax=Cognatiluteimonas sedimenti TaxID=2927791 RepID=A0ABT0A0G8_9GAMM|nr:calcineurin-like phosphoesterase C-terminal domain-containing protein [Lysobacter sedimenti]MCJ0824469.1 calcineurin-like phosphoesterase C-terminal domain-containing protein [Lysobacter sedimenti]